MPDKFLILVDVFLCFAVAFLAWRDTLRAREIAILRQTLRDVDPPSSRILPVNLPGGTGAISPAPRRIDVRVVDAPPLRRSARKPDDDGDSTIIAGR